MQFHILSFEGPDPYSRAGGLATRVEGLSDTLAALGFEQVAWRQLATAATITTVSRYAWPAVVERVLLPRVELTSRAP